MNWLIRKMFFCFDLLDFLLLLLSNFMKIETPWKNKSPWSDRKMFNSMQSQGCLSQTFPFLFILWSWSETGRGPSCCERSLGSSRSRKVSLISSLCDGVSSLDPDFAIVPLPEPDWRMTALSHWRKQGGQRRAQGHIWVSGKSCSHPLISFESAWYFTDLRVPAAPQGSACWPVREKIS